MTTTDQERADLLEALGQARYFLRFTVQNLTDEQAGLRSVPASQLCLGGLIKHVADTEKSWADFIEKGAPTEEGASTGTGPSEGEMAAYAEKFQMSPGDTLEGVLAVYTEVAARTDRLVRELPSLDVAHELPPAPWFEPGKKWSARRVLHHLIAETAQHAGHADILRESIDGQKSMG